MNEEQLLAGREFLRELGASVRAFALYPAGHPLREERLHHLAESARRIHEDENSFDFFVHEDSFFYGEKLLSKESMTFQWMLKDWQNLQIHSVTVLSGATNDDLSNLVLHVAGKAPAPTSSVQINAASLMRPGEHAAVVSTTRLRSAYSNALDIIRELGDRVQGGGTPTVGVARETVDGLVDAVLADHESALLLATMHSHDETTFFHMVNVSILSVATGAAIGLERQHLNVLGLGGLLHDMGKVAIPPQILNRVGRLSDDDWKHIRRHPLQGSALILRSWEKISPLAATIAYEHHIHMDGAGYPIVPLGPKPDLFSRIVAVADTFDALTSRRPYRRAEQRERALDVLLSGAGPHYDPRIVKVFVRMLGFYPPGSLVELSDGSTAMVIRNNHEALSKPLVKIVRDAQGEFVEPQDLDLNSERQIRIVKGMDQETSGIEPTDFVA